MLSVVKNIISLQVLLCKITVRGGGILEAHCAPFTTKSYIRRPEQHRQVLCADHKLCPVFQTRNALLITKLICFCNLGPESQMIENFCISTFAVSEFLHSQI